MTSTPATAAPQGLRRVKAAVARRIASTQSLMDQLRYGQPNGLVTTAQLRAESPQGWARAFAAGPVRRRPPVMHGSVPIEMTGVAAAWPELGVATVQDGCLLGPQGWAFTADHRFITDASWYGTDATARLLPRAFTRVRRLEGRCLSLASDFAHGNYAHFVLDTLSRAELFRFAGGRLEEADHIFLPRPPSSSARRIMHVMGIAPDKCVWADPGTWLQADELLVTTFPGLKRNYPDWLPPSLQQYFPDKPPRRDRLYVPRTGVRKAVNEAELIDIARQFGFRVHDFERCPGEPEAFAAAEAVIGAHGAGLANLAYCGAGTRVLELMPADHVHPYYYTLAESAGLDYHCLGGRSLGSRPPGTFGPSPFDFVVDPREFRAALISMDL